MGNSHSGPKITAQDRAVLDLKLQRDKLKQYQRKIEAVLNREREIAKESLAAGRKDRALTALRRRKYQEGLLSKTDGQLETLQNLVSSIEFSLIEKDILFGLKQGNDVLKEIHKELNVEAVEKLMDESADAIAYQKEVDELLSTRVTADDEDEVQKELKALEAEAEALNNNKSELPELPSAPTTALPKRERERQEVLEDEEEEEPIRTRQPIAA